MGAFKLVRIMQGNGWPSGHIAIDEHYTFPNKPGGSEWCLNLDTCSAEELSSDIDKLIKELEEIRTIAPKKFQEWNEQLGRK